MRVLSSILIVNLLQLGCGSSYIVSSSPAARASFAAFNGDAVNEEVKIEFEDGSTVYAREVTAGSDSTSLLDVATGVRTLVPTHGIKRIVITIDGLGILEGAGIGLLTGTAGGLAVLAAHTPGGHEDYTGAIAILFGGTGGFLVGAIVGGLIGHSHQYSFPKQSVQP